MGVQATRDPDTGERLFHYEWLGGLWCEREGERFEWETGEVTCPYCGDVFECGQT